MPYMYCERGRSINITSIKIFSSTTSLLAYIDTIRQSLYNSTVQRLSNSSIADWVRDREQTLLTRLSSLDSFIGTSLGSYAFRQVYKIQIDPIPSIRPRKLTTAEIVTLIDNTPVQNTLSEEISSESFDEIVGP